MKRIVILCTVISTLMIAARAEAQPNIIYINADDLGVMDVGFNNPKYKTPNLDRLRAAGMLFTEAYAPAANCAPSRACVFSGQYGPRHGIYTVGTSERGKSAYRKIIPVKNTVHLSPEVLTLAEVLKAGGYQTIHLGKWHLGDDPTQQGFDVNVGGYASGSPKGGYFIPVKGEVSDYNDRYPKGTHIADIFADQAVQFIKAGKDEPFFMHMAYYLIHTPIQAVPGMVEKYGDAQDRRAAYASMIEKMDESIGKILVELDAQGLRDNTLVLFCSDNGAHSDISTQKPHRSGKGSYFEGGIREPLVVRWPGKVEPGSTCDVPVMGIDFFPTFLEAAGIPVPGGKILDGVSLMPLLTQSGTIPERTLFWHFPVYLQAYAGQADDAHDPLFRTRPGAVLRQGKWKFHEYFEDGRLELYDLANDPGERNNVALLNPEKTAELHQVMGEWRAELQAPVPSEPNPEYDAAAERKALLPLVKNGPCFANGAKVGEVDSDSAIIWVRLTASPMADFERLPIFTSGLGEGVPDEGAMPDDVVPGMTGQARVLFWPDSETGDGKRVTEWITVRPDNDYIHQFHVEGLRAGQRYSYAVESREVGGSAVAQTIYGQFRTAPNENMAPPIRFIVTTCQALRSIDAGAEGHSTYAQMLDFEPHFLVHTGDIVYYDKAPLAKTISQARAKWNMMFAYRNNRYFHQNVTSYFMKDDHDTLKNDCWPGQTYGDLTFDQGLAIFREQVPMGDLTYRSYRWGKDVEIWMTEHRDFRSPNQMPDGPEKTILGGAQKAWLKRTLEQSDATYKFVITPGPVVGPDKPGKKDNHSNEVFSHEGQELRDFLGALSNTYVICGDRHWQYLSKDPETGLLEMGCGPINDQHNYGGNPGEVKEYHQYFSGKGGFLGITVENGEAKAQWFGTEVTSGKPSVLHTEILGKPNPL
jgi:arylsulfatase A-like enzyme